MDLTPLPEELASIPFIGCAGWSIASSQGAAFPEEGSHLQRYASVLPAVEINTSFYRPHRPETYARWRVTVPEHFRFSVKIPRTITHDQRLQNFHTDLARFLSEVSHLEEKLGCLLLQLPPSLGFAASIAQSFFAELTARIDTAVVCEARHISWFATEAADMLALYGIAPVLADPPATNRSVMLGDAQTVYVRLHGSPDMYHSRYSEDYLTGLARELRDFQSQGRQVWCIFENTASGAALPNALSLASRFTLTEGIAPE
jgi:uncharacterized protein YecE (DUF72 family)